MPLHETDIQPPDDQKTLEWIAALASAGMDYRLSRQQGTWLIHVASEQAELALRIILEHEEVNRGWPPPIRPLTLPQTVYRTWAGLWGTGLIVLFYFWLGPSDANPNPLVARAVCNADLVKAGQWWRTVTALMLHSGFAHLAGNALFLGILGVGVCRVFGGGVGWLIMLLAGAGANLTAALASEFHHAAVGASGVCFAALGILSVHQAVRNLRRFGDWRSVWSRAWLPLSAGLALLGLMGTGPGTDIAAHGLGFVYGMFLSIPLNFFLRRSIPEWGQRILELLCLGIALGAWWPAVKAG